MAEQSVNPDVNPYKIVMAFEMAGTEEEAIEMSNAIVGDAHERGVFIDFAVPFAIDPVDVKVGSELHQALTGEGPRA